MKLALPDLRVGTGVDAHRFADGRRLMLGGVEIPHARGLAGDSDADALLHAVADALLGAAGLGDLGVHFPPGATSSIGLARIELDSAKIVTEVLAKITRDRWEIQNVDATVIAQVPKLSPHLSKMKESIAALLSLPADRVNVKAKSTDRLGFLGREEGVAALATVLLARERA